MRPYRAIMMPWLLAIRGDCLMPPVAPPPVRPPVPPPVVPPPPPVASRLMPLVEAAESPMPAIAT